ncbi:MAG: Holliday junction branch migration protein RuvA [Clostridia bacterium]|nr:Holliday junction branch migration protein RuvA [Clostridia bacterium]
MYYYLNGTLEYRDINTCVIDCGGVGYKLTVSLITSELCSSKIGQKIKLFTYLAIRENEIELFGFNSNEERLCFNQLISVSGVGPKAAMSILSIMTPDRFSLAVCTEDVKAISKASGIGAKTAARIVLELKDKISKDMMSTGTKFDIPQAASASVTLNGKLNDAMQALLVLGLDKNTAMNALKGIDATNLDSGEIVKAALKKLNQK